MLFIVDNSTQNNIICLDINAPAHTVGEAFRLLENLLQHEVRISALLYLAETDVYGLHLWRELHVVHVHHLQVFTTTHHGDIAVVEIHNTVGIFNDRTRIGTEEELVLANTYNKRTLLACRNDGVGVVLVYNCDGICSYHLM